ncbi:MAG: toxin glutamine deamidase domain-containing protein [Planctomycetia bacterium]|nr:toxin glutamine deamidase domain-containing protein [Planctomycetia bacterium]
MNCGNIVDAVIARLTGKNPWATAPFGQDGLFSEIGKRHGTTIRFGHSFDDAFSTVRNGGNGTTAIVGIIYKGGNSHVVVMTNRGGQVAIIEGQDAGAGNPRGLVTTPERARQQYGADSDVGIGVLS